jgi:hypothetical protein
MQSPCWKLGCAFLQDSQEFLQERCSCKYFTGIMFPAKHRKDRNGLSLHLAFVRRSRKCLCRIGLVDAMVVFVVVQQKHTQLVSTYSSNDDYY